MTAVLALVIGVVGGLAGALLVGVIHAALEPGARRDKLAIAFVATAVIIASLRYLAENLLVRVAQDLLRDARVDLSLRILAAPLAQIEAMGQARLFTILADDVQAIAVALPAMLGFLPQLAIVVGCFAYMARVSLPLFGAAMGALVAGLAVHMFLQRLALRRLEAARTELDRLTERFRELTMGIKELRLNQRRRREFAEHGLAADANAVREQAARGMRSWVAAANWGHSLLTITIGCVIFVAPSALDLAAGVVSGFTLAILYVARPVEFAMSAMPVLGRALVALDSINAAGFALGTTDGDDRPAAAPASTFASLRLSAVTYVYPGSERNGVSFALGPIDFEIAAGEVVFVVGGNGTGKTTFAKLVTGLYEATSGTIAVDQRAIDRGSLAEYQELFAAIFPDSFIFDVLHGLPKTAAHDAVVRKHLRTFGLGSIEVDRGRLSTTIALSQGQRKRLALVTALLEDRPIYVLDEWAADQDPSFRERFYRELIPDLQRRGKAVIVITHDDRFFHLADRVVKLEDGRLHEERPAGIDTVSTLAAATARMPA
jgi:putative pyoverdin transport system ATP-binding/permease protein